MAESRADYFLAPFDPSPGYGIRADRHLHLLLAATALTGAALWWLLPAGYARPLATDPWRLAGFLLLYPLLEEWLFRGVLQGELLRHGWGRARRLGLSQANVLTSVAFVLLHTVHHPWYWALAVVVPSLVLGHFRERYASLWIPVALHGLFNLTWLLAGLGWAGGP